MINGILTGIAALEGYSQVTLKCGECGVTTGSIAKMAAHDRDWHYGFVPVGAVLPIPLPAYATVSVRRSEQLKSLL